MAARVPSIPHKQVVSGLHGLWILEHPDLLPESVVDTRRCDSSKDVFVVVLCWLAMAGLPLVSAARDSILVRRLSCCFGFAG